MRGDINGQERTTVALMFAIGFLLAVVVVLV